MSPDLKDMVQEFEEVTSDIRQRAGVLVGKVQILVRHLPDCWVDAREYGRVG